MEQTGCSGTPCLSTDGQLIRGFTLIELLIAISIFSLIALVSFEGLRLAGATQERITQARTRQAEIETALTIISNDLIQLAPRAVRDASGSLQPAYIRNNKSASGQKNTRYASSYPLIFTRAGIMQMGLLYEHGLQRVAYNYDANTRQLRRIVWPVLDTGNADTPRAYPILSGVTAVDFRQIDQEFKEHLNWPPADTNIHADQNNQINRLMYLPYAIKLKLELDDLGLIERIIPGVSVPYHPKEQPKDKSTAR